MGLLRDRSTIVLVGAWNLSIFQPQWVSESLFGGGPVTTELEMSPHLTWRFVARSGPALEVSDHRAAVGAVNGDLEAAAEVATGLVERLADTPLTGVGLNVQYDGEATDSVLAIRDHMTAGDVLGKHEWLSAQSKWTLACPAEGLDRQLNVSVQFHAHPRIVIDFNLHHPMTSSAAAAKPVLADGFGPVLEAASELGGRMVRGTE